MTLSIDLSDQATHIIQTQINRYGSADAVIESALLKMQLDDDLDDPEYLEYIRQAIEEAEADTDPP
ncbi:MAG: hypothetical protein HQL93_13860, partial [Magnetococcales bacterium]|nr:hypothetical protein [Magnetococcales bacterium]